MHIRDVFILGKKSFIEQEKSHDWWFPIAHWANKCKNKRKSIILVVQARTYCTSQQPRMGEMLFAKDVTCNDVTCNNVTWVKVNVKKTFIYLWFLHSMLYFIIKENH